MSVSKNKSHSPKESSKDSVIRILIASLVSMLLLVGLLFASSVLLLSKGSESMTPILAYLSLGVSAIIGGFLCGKLIKRKGLVFGIICGLPSCLLMLILCTVLAGAPGSGAVFGCMEILLCSAVGGILSVNKKRKKIRYK